MVNNIIDLLRLARESGVHISLYDGELQLKATKGKTVDQALLQNIRDNKDRIKKFLLDDSLRASRVASFESDLRPIDRTSIPFLPLSFSQERLWFIDQLEGSLQYHLPAVLNLNGSLDKQALFTAFKIIVDRHEVLRTVYLQLEDGTVYQEINDHENWNWQLIDNSGSGQSSERLKKLIAESTGRRFDLSKDYMLRVILVVNSDQQHLLIVTMHHIASDGWSLSLLVNEVAALYNSIVHKFQHSLRPLTIQYADYAYWQRKYLTGETLDKKIAYWKSNLQGVSPLELPIDFQRPTVNSINGDVFHFKVPSNTIDLFNKFCIEQQVTPFMALLAVFNVLLSKYSGQRDIAVGSPIAGRQQPELEILIGYFVNTLVLRSDIDPAKNFTQLLTEIKRTTTLAYEHQDVPFEKIVDAVYTSRDINRNPLFQVMFGLQSNPKNQQQLEIGGLNFSKQSIEHTTAKFDLSLFIADMNGQLHGSFEYNTDLFRAETISRMAGHFNNLLSSIVASPLMQVGKLKMVGNEEEQILNGFNNNRVNYPTGKTIIDLFAEQVATTPDNIAVSFENEQLSYKQLNERANKLANYLKKQGVKNETLVPICMERGLNMLTGILAILKAGGAYVPIDPEYPAERVNYMLEDTAASIIVTSELAKGNINQSNGIEIISVDGQASAIEEQDGNNLKVEIASNGLAYVIYTSGSTGKPKGVMIEHGNVYAFICWSKDEFATSNFDVVFASTSMCFDLSVYEMFYPLVTGKRVRIVKNGLDIINYLEEEKNILTNTVPVVIEHLLKEGANLENISVINMAGEPISSYVHERLDADKIEVRNLYGPTEDTTYSTVFRLENNKAVLIGKPITNSEAFILSDSLELVPVGIAGEICLGGAGIARGYLNRPELTAEKFIRHPFDKAEGARLYRTGDLGRWLPDGNIEYLGRIDDQVKIRGYRIELGEIETVLLQSAMVSQAVVVAKQDAQGTRRLVSYVVAGKDFSKEAAKEYLSTRLPEYMVPQIWVELEQLPLTPNGKIDKKALPDPESTGEIASGYVAPGNHVELKLANIWQGLLGIERIGIYDNFFELGGHSLLAMRFISQVRRDIQAELSIRDLFTKPTIASLAQHIRSTVKDRMLPEVEFIWIKPDRIPLSFSQERLWFIDQLEGSTQYHIPSVLKLKGKLRTDALEFALKEVVTRHEVLRTIFIETDGLVSQQVNEVDNWKIKKLNFQKSGDVNGISNTVYEIIARPFNLCNDYMMRAELLSLSTEEHILVVVMHHIASDGWSLPLLVNEVTELYNSFTDSRVSKLKPLVIQYSDYAIWQRKYLSGELLNKKIGYWKNKLSGVSPIELPLDHVRPAVQSTNGAYESLSLSVDLSGRVKALSKDSGATLFMTMLSAFKVLLHRYTAQTDITVGTPIANRQQAEVQDLIGFFVNTLSIRSELTSASSFKSFLENTKLNVLEAYEHQEVPFEKVVEAVSEHRDLSRTPVFQVMFVLQNEIHPVKGEDKSLNEVQISRDQISHDTSKYELTLFITESKDGLRGGIEYNRDLFERATIARMLEHFTQLLKSITESPQLAIGKLEMISDAEKGQLFDFNKNQSSYPVINSIVELFEEQATAKPDKIAVLFQDQKLTYTQLNANSNKLARYLLGKGLKRGQIVALSTGRTAHTIIGILAILKAGGAYMPIDKDYPSERIKLMLADSQAELLLSNNAHLPKDIRISMINIDLDWSIITNESAENLGHDLRPDDLAYTIYTSGSTGIPKGTLVEHRNVVSLVKKAGFIELSEREIILSTGSPAFDATTFEYWGALLNGGQVIISLEEDLLNTDTLKQTILENSVTTMWFTSSWFNQLVETDINIFKTLHTILVGGEKLSEPHINKLRKAYPSIKIINGYGPTENTTFSLTYPIEEDEIKGIVPIGKPLSNRSAFILSDSLELVPVGIAGEICLGGAGIARGYLNRPELTAEKFIRHPFDKAEGARLYRTGDLGRWLPDGNIEYLGRIDDQVKIRGYRIELGEIETVLLQSAMVSQAVVVAKQDAQGRRRLVSYVVAGKDFSKEAAKEYLSTRLPEYMVPQIWVELEQLPLTPNGKIDKKALPDPDMTGLSSSTYAEPESATEKELAAVWQILLGQERVGLNDNFFELGGDSIMTIQVVSRLRRLGYVLQPKDIFIHQTVGRLSKAIAQRAAEAERGEQGLLRGESGLLPIQQWYLERQHAEPSHFNQAVLVGIDKQVEEEVLSKALEAIIAQHDALRFSYRKESGAWKQTYGEAKTKLEVKDLGNTGSSAFSEAVADIAREAHRSLDIEQGQLIRVFLIKTPETEKHNRLLIVIHHLAVDGVSWRILIEDFEQLLEGYAKGEEASAGSKTGSYRQWYQGLEEYSKSRSLLLQENYWKQAREVYEPLPVDKSFEGKARIKDNASKSLRLNQAETKQLLQEVPRVYHTEINDILLAALAATLSGWSGRDKVTIGLEGHGRENLPGSVDVSRTVGWFTSLYPVVLDGSKKKTGEANLIKSIKEDLRRVPDKGIGYGVLKYIKGSENLAGKDPWDIVFNYLGQVDNVVRESKWFAGAGESSGAALSPEYEARDKLSLTGIVSAGELTLGWTYSKKYYEEETIDKLGAEFIKNLRDIIAHVAELDKQGKRIYTPSDYGLTEEVSYEELDRFLDQDHKGSKRKEQIDGLYRLSGLQQGMLFHGLYDGGAGGYIEQLACDLVDVDLQVLSRSWEEVLRNHSILRSAFYYNEFSVPVQVVYRKVELPVEVLDYSEMSKEKQDQAIKEYETLDRSKGFDFRAAPLMRFGLIKLSGNRYRMLWTSHHILFDGWSLPILMEEFLSSYEELVNGRPVKEKPEDRYEDFIRYIERVDKEEEEQYWRDYMKGVEDSTLLPFIGSTTERTKGVGVYKTVNLHLDQELTGKVQSYVQQHHLTINTLMQAVWSYLLHRYTGSPDVVYGVIVSGRPDDLAGVESRVGMYINTLPLHSHLDLNNEEGKKTEISAWLKDMQATQVSSRSYQHTPLQDIQSWTGVQGDLFDSLLIFENYPVSEKIAEKKWSIGIENMQVKEQTNYPLVVLINSSDKIGIQFGYNSAILGDDYVERISGHYEHVLLQVISNEITSAENIKLVTATEEIILLEDFNNTSFDYDRKITVLELFEENAASKFSKTALHFNEREISYADLNNQANQLANLLISEGINPGTLVPVCMPRSIDLVISVLAIMKTGAAYVPVDPEYPADRINFMLADTAATILLVNQETKQQHIDAGLKLIDVTSSQNELPITKPAVKILANDLAYVIYTSGSTGLPKGVMIEHAALLNLVSWHNAEYQVNASSSATSMAGVGFDAFGWEIWPYLAAGATVTIIEDKDRLSPSSLVAIFAKQRISHSFIPTAIVPDFITAYGSKHEKDLKYVLTGGDKLVLPPSQELSFQLVNNYGPTENTVVASFYKIGADYYESSPPIGKPISNTSIYIVDQQFQLSPIGVAGEICISGESLARGYFNRDNLTAEKFINNPFSRSNHTRLYRTGDLGKWLPDGNLEFLGRIDDQVKIRGYRIELGEIENVLLQSKLVSQGIVLAVDVDSNTKRLVAYVVATEHFSKEAAKSYLGAKLPDYMIPQVWIEIDFLPLTANGKIDKKALPIPDQGLENGLPYVAPRNELEEKLAGIWMELLKVDKVGVYDNFFEMGGNSLLAMRIVSFIERNLSLTIPIHVLFRSTTINDLSKYLEIQAGKEPDNKNTTAFELIDI